MAMRCFIFGSLCVLATAVMTPEEVAGGSVEALDLTCQDSDRLKTKIVPQALHLSLIESLACSADGQNVLSGGGGTIGSGM